MTKENKRVYFGQDSASDFRKRKDEGRKNRYMNRHEKIEDWGKSGIDTAG